MRFLRTGFIAITVRLGRQILLAKLGFDMTTHHIHRIITQEGRVGTHIGNETGFIQALRQHHGFLHRKTETGTGCLL